MGWQLSKDRLLFSVRLSCIPILFNDRTTRRYYHLHCHSACAGSDHINRACPDFRILLCQTPRLQASYHRSFQPATRRFVPSATYWAVQAVSGVTMASLPPPHSHQLLVKRINSSNYLINKQMQHICQLNGMRTQGVKADLQRRIIDGTWFRFEDGLLSRSLSSYTTPLARSTWLPRLKSSCTGRSPTCTTHPSLFSTKLPFSKLICPAPSYFMSTCDHLPMADVFQTKI